MTLGRYDLPRDEPFYWWGPVWAQPRELTLAQLIGQRMLSADEAAMLAVLFRRGVSLFVISLASGAGKSTLLDAVVRSGVEIRERIYLRGSYETFDFLGRVDPQHSSLLVNEISAHLPIYLWGPAVRTFFHAAPAGFQLCATAHAENAMAFIHLLTSPPLDVPLEDVHQPNVVVTLQALDSGGNTLRSVRSITGISPGTSFQASTVNLFTERREPGAPVQTYPDRLAPFLQVAGLEPIEFLNEMADLREVLIDQGAKRA